jgi:hypothetical protein
MVYPKTEKKVADTWSSQAKTNSIILIIFARYKR